MHHRPLVIRPHIDRADDRAGSLRDAAQLHRGALRDQQGAHGALAEYSRDCLRALRAATGIAYDERTQGTLQLFRTQKQFDGSAGDIAVLREQRRRLRAARPRRLHPPRAGAGAGAREVRRRPAPARRRDRRLLQVHAGAGRARRRSAASTFRFGTTIRGLVPQRRRASTASPPTPARSTPTPTWSRSAATRRCCCAPLGMRIPVYPVKGYSITVPITDAAGAPESTVMDETHKVAVTRLGDRIRVGGTAELAGYTLQAARGAAARRSTHVVSDLFPGGGDARPGRVLVRPAADDARRHAGDRRRRRSPTSSSPPATARSAGPWRRAPAASSPTSISGRSAGHRPRRPDDRPLSPARCARAARLAMAADRDPLAARRQRRRGRRRGRRQRSRRGASLAVVEAMKMEHEVRATQRRRGRVGARARRRSGRRGRAAARRAASRQSAAAAVPDGPVAGGRRPATACAPTCSSCATARRCSRTPAARKPSPSATPSACARRARTSPTCATPAASSSTARSPSPRSAAGAALDDLIRNTPADGMVTGIGSVNGDAFGAERVARRRHGLRRDGARRHAGHAQPPEDRPPARRRARRSGCRSCCSPKAAAAGPATSTCPIVAGLHVATFAQLRAAERPGAAGRHRRRSLLRRQRGAARLLRRRSSRRASSSIGMGGPAMIEGGGLGVVPARGDRPERRADRAHGVDRRPGRRRGRSGRGRRAATCAIFQGRVARAGRRRPAAAARRCCPTQPPARLRHARGRRRARRRRHRCSSCAPASAPASSPRWPASRAGRSASSPTTRRTSAARSTPTRPTRRRASCSSATRTGCRSSR